MSSVKDTLDLIRDEFSIFLDPRDKYVYLVDLAKDIKGLSLDQRNEENLIYGCTSQAWVLKEISDQNYIFRTDSDAMIVKGLLSLIERSFNGQTKEEILKVNGNEFLESIGLGKSISSQRTNGFSSAIEKIQKELLD